ncbi:early activation antigen CD69 isoform X2 [Mugil cephalus]|uniref:early activation antigen CD69 isoform X2 n=1 Tax=Mugil cephalus TaxID=48193 RepID=UPI001FB59FC7|nr:early activation antigen CD69 isoform X2 [Mugil cephalus]
MYIKFWRSYVEDKKDEVSENLSSKLSVKLEEEKGKQSEGNVRRYRAACLLLLVTCIVLLLVIVALAVNMRTGPTVCPVPEDTRAYKPADGQNPASAPTCSFEQCQFQYSDSFVQRIGCQQCSKGWLAFGRSCYYLSTIRMNWDQSQRNCTARGGSLAVVGNQKVQNFLTAKGSLKYWIGLRNRADAWTWVNNTMLRESFWQEPSRVGDCGILCSDINAEKNWISASCQAQAYYICEVQL